MVLGKLLNSNKQNNSDNSLNTTSKTVVGAINELDGRLDEFPRIHMEYVLVALTSNSSVSPFTHYGSKDVTSFMNAYIPIGLWVITGGSVNRAIANTHGNTLYVYGTVVETVTVAISGILR